MEIKKREFVVDQWAGISNGDGTFTDPAENKIYNESEREKNPCFELLGDDYTSLGISSIHQFIANAIKMMEKDGRTREEINHFIDGMGYGLESKGAMRSAILVRNSWMKR